MRNIHIIHPIKRLSALATRLPAIATGLPALVLASCTMEIASPAPSLSEEPILFSTAVRSVAVTRTAAVTTLDSIYVVCYSGFTGSMEQLVFNEVFRPDAETRTVFTSGRCWPLTDGGYRFYAANVPIVHRLEGSYVEVSNDRDVLTATLPDAAWKKPNTLVFTHAFARLGTMTVTVSDNYILSDLTVTMTPLVGGRLFPCDGSWTLTRQGEPLVLATRDGVTAASDLYVVPGEYELSATYVLTKGDYTKAFNRKGRVTLPAGFVSNLFTDIGKTGDAVEIAFSVAVEPWTDMNHVLDM